MRRVYGDAIRKNAGVITIIKEAVDRNFQRGYIKRVIQEVSVRARASSRLYTLTHCLPGPRHDRW